MNDNQSSGSNRSFKRDIHRQTLKSIGWKLLIVAVALAAYAGQKALERTKQTYDGERSRPLVIVDDADPKLADARQTNRREDFIPLRVSRIQKLLSDAEQRPHGAKETGQIPLADFINRIKYQNLKNENEIIDRLNAEVLLESDLTKRAYLDTRDTLNKNRAAKLALLADEKTQVYNRLMQVVSEKTTETDEQEKSEQAKAAIQELRKTNPPDEKQLAELKRPGGGKVAAAARTSRRGAAQSTAGVLSIDEVLAKATKEQLAVWLNTLDKQIRDEQNVEVARQGIADADRVAQSQIKTIYEALRPQLSGIVRDAKLEQGITAPSGRVTAFFDPRSIFNDKSGSYVIYQTLWLICIGVVVFFVVFLFFALLRPLPFFAGKSETLASQFERLLSRPGAAEGAAPQLARSLIISAAALGVGTAAAVAVAGDRAINRPQLGGGDSAVVAAAYEPGDERSYLPGTRRIVDPPRTPLKVELTPQIIYPQPTVIEHMMYAAPGGSSFDPSLFTDLNGKVMALTTSNANLIHTIDYLKTEVQKVNDVEKGVAGLKLQVGEVKVPALESKVLLVEQSTKSSDSKIVGLDGRLVLMEKQFAISLDSISKDLTETKQAVSDLRNNSFERTQNSGGRGFITRTQQLFRGDRFMVSHQSFEALKDLMCRGGCGTDTDKTKMIDALKSLVGQPPRDQSNFLKSFALVTPNVLKQWKPLLLKYTRVPY